MQFLRFSWSAEFLFVSGDTGNFSKSDEESLTTVLPRLSQLAGLISQKLSAIEMSAVTKEQDVSWEQKVIAAVNDLDMRTILRSENPITQEILWIMNCVQCHYESLRDDVERRSIVVLRPHSRKCKLEHTMQRHSV